MKTAVVVSAIILCTGCQQNKRNEHVQAYNEQLVLPTAHVRAHDDLYARHKALCNPKDRMGRWNCDQVEVDVANIREAERQELIIYEQMENDPALNHQDREVARQGVAKLRAILGNRADD